LKERRFTLVLQYDYKLGGDNNVQAVTVTRFRIPFGDMVFLYLQAAGAGLIAFGIPIAIIIAVTG